MDYWQKCVLCIRNFNKTKLDICAKFFKNIEILYIVIKDSRFEDKTIDDVEKYLKNIIMFDKLQEFSDIDTIQHADSDVPTMSKNIVDWLPNLEQFQITFCNNVYDICKIFDYILNYDESHSSLEEFKINIINITKNDFKHIMNIFKTNIKFIKN